MKTISSLEAMLVAEMITIRHRLRRRFGIGQRGNIIDVAFGMAEHDQVLDRSRPDAICFYVRRKCCPRAKVDRIPPRLAFRLKRGSRFVQIELATDVILIGTRRVRATGERISHADYRGRGTTGGVVAWKVANQSPWQWGVLTVGHLFHGVSSLPEPNARVQIGDAAAGPIAGTLLVCSRPSDRPSVDAALVAVERSLLVSAQLIPDQVSTAGKRIRPISVLKHDRGATGFTFPERVTLDFRVVRFLPISDMVPALGSLSFVSEAIGQPGTFGVGRSGSLWAIQRQAAALQHGGLPWQFARGWGQSLEYVLAWCAEQLALIHRQPTAAVDLRLIRVI
jgi:hypothetical protein